MKIIIAGAGEVGTHLAKLLAKESLDTTLLDENPDRLTDLEMNTTCSPGSAHLLLSKV